MSFWLFFYLFIFTFTHNYLHNQYNERKVYAKIKAKEYMQFEDIKYIRKDGSESWSAREFVAVIDYSQWRNLEGN